MDMKEFKNKNFVFMTIGIVLMMTVFFCMFLYAKDKKLIETQASVIEVDKDTATATYEINNLYYQYTFRNKKKLNVGDKLRVYYYSNNVDSVKQYKTSELVFLCPLSGLLLFILGMIFYIKNDNSIDEDDLFKTKVISVIGNTEKLEIITDDLDDSDLEFEKEEDVQEKKEQPVLEKLLPKYFYIVGETLVCEFIGDKVKELDLKNINKFVKTINSLNNLVKVVISTNEFVITLTNMPKVDLLGVSNTIQNKLLIVNPEVKVLIEHKEY